MILDCRYHVRGIALKNGTFGGILFSRETFVNNMSEMINKIIMLITNFYSSGARDGRFSWYIVYNKYSQIISNLICNWSNLRWYWLQSFPHITQGIWTRVGTRNRVDSRQNSKKIHACRNSLGQIVFKLWTITVDQSDARILTVELPASEILNSERWEHYWFFDTSLRCILLVLCIVRS